MKKFYPFGFVIIFIFLVSIACDLSKPSNPNLEETRIALAIEQTQFAMIQSGINQTVTPITNQAQRATSTLTSFPQSQPPSVTPTFTTQPPTQTTTQTSTQTQANQALPGFSNLTDYFKDPNSGWPEKTIGDYRYWYGMEHYHIQVDRLNTQVVVPSSYMMTNGSVITSGLILDQTSSPLAYYGVVCRLQDEDNYYFFEISYDGFYRIGKVWNNVLSLIGMGTAKFSSAINIADYNQITAECWENELRLTINSTFIETVYDNTFTSGYTGLCATSNNIPGIIAAFEYFIAEEY